MQRRYILLDVRTPNGDQKTDLHFVSYEVWQRLTAYLVGVVPDDTAMARQLTNIAEQLGYTDPLPMDRDRIAAVWVHTHAQTADLPRWSCTLP